MNIAVFEKFDIDVQFQAPLSEFTTFRLGGTCPALLTCQTPQQLQQTVKSCVQEKLKYILIGGGSNLVVSDEGLDCQVIRYVSDTPLIEHQGNDLIVSGSTSLDQLAQFAVDNGLEGLNCVSGIPGTVGGAVVGNAGAFGKQIGDVVKWVKVLRKERSRALPTMTEAYPPDLQFSYRHSKLKKTGDIVVSTRLSLKRADRTLLQMERDKILAYRRQRHPNLAKDPCAGSFFRNIEPTSKAGKRQAAGWFLDQAGGKKLKVGGARIFSKHANIIIKSNGCTAQDVYELSGQMARLVKDKFDLELLREIRFVGQFNGMPKGIKDIIW